MVWFMFGAQEDVQPCNCKNARTISKYILYMNAILIFNLPVLKSLTIGEDSEYIASWLAEVTKYQNDFEFLLPY